MKGVSLKEIVKSKGVREVVGVIEECLALPENDKDYLDPITDFSFRELWEALVGPVQETLPYAAKSRRGGLIDPELMMTPLTEAALSSTAFPTVTGALINKMVMKGYEQPGLLGPQLVTNMPSKLKTEKFAGFGEPESMQTVRELEEYRESSLGEKYVETTAEKKGRIISVSEEAIFFDQTGQILTRAEKLGGRAALEKEKKILYGITEPSSAYYCYKPSGSAEAVWRGDNTATSNALVDWTDMEAAELKFDLMTDDQSESIVIAADALLVPSALKYTAMRIIGAVGLEKRTDSAANITRFNNPLGGYKVYSSPLVKACSGSASTWWLGRFKEQYYWQEVWPIQVARQGRDSDLAFERDIVARFKVRYYGTIFSVDWRYVVKNTA